MKSPRLWLLLFVLAVPIPGQAETPTNGSVDLNGVSEVVVEVSDQG